MNKWWNKCIVTSFPVKIYLSWRLISAHTSTNYIDQQIHKLHISKYPLVSGVSFIKKIAGSKYDLILRKHSHTMHNEFCITSNNFKQRTNLLCQGHFFFKVINLGILINCSTKKLLNVETRLRGLCILHFEKRAKIIIFLTFGLKQI